MAKRLYLGRSANDDYELGTQKNKWSPTHGFPICSGAYIGSFYTEPFEAFTGIRLEPGEIRRVKRITIELA